MTGNRGAGKILWPKEWQVERSNCIFAAAALILAVRANKAPVNNKSFDKVAFIAFSGNISAWSKCNAQRVTPGLSYD
jgi:hypothetical protein